MPIFGSTLAAIGEVADNDASPTSALGRIILRDAGMTARVLRMANSVFFRGDNQRVSTISRAIVVLGFDTVRDIAVSVALIDSFLAGGVRTRVASEMARCFHAAVHARHAASARGDGSAEEVFIATLLSHIGEMSFWCFSGELGQRLDQALRRSTQPPEQVEQDVVGFRLRALTQVLAREWKLPGLVAAACADRVRVDSREALVVAGYRLAAASEDGWKTERARAAIRDYAKVLKQDYADVAAAVAVHAKEAARIAAFYGADEAASRIPVATAQEIAAEIDQAGTAEPDPMLQLDVARRMATALADGEGSGVLLDLALEGAARSLGADRACVAMLSANRAQLAVRSADGLSTQTLNRHFNFLLAGAPRDALTDLADQGRSIDIAAGRAPAPGLPSVARLRAALGDRHLVLVPVRANGQVIGALYIDRAASRPPFPEGTQEALLQFARLAGLAFDLTAVRRS